MSDQAHRVLIEDKLAFVKAVNALNDLLQRVRRYEPEACLYVTGDDFQLMTGEPWEGGRDRQDRVALRWRVPHTDSGAW